MFLWDGIGVTEALLGYQLQDMMKLIGAGDVIDINKYGTTERELSAKDPYTVIHLVGLDIIERTLVPNGVNTGEEDGVRDYFDKQEMSKLLMLTFPSNLSRPSCFMCGK